MGLCLLNKGRYIHKFKQYNICACHAQACACPSRCAFSPSSASAPSVVLASTRTRQCPLHAYRAPRTQARRASTAATRARARATQGTGCTPRRRVCSVRQARAGRATGRAAWSVRQARAGRAAGRAAWSVRQARAGRAAGRARRARPAHTETTETRSTTRAARRVRRTRARRALAARRRESASATQATHAQYTCTKAKKCATRVSLDNTRVRTRMQRARPAQVGPTRARTQAPRHVCRVRRAAARTATTVSVILTQATAAGPSLTAYATTCTTAKTAVRVQPARQVLVVACRLGTSVAEM